MKPNVYFLGIGGIGMANLARYCLAQSMQVAGYDRTLSELTAQLGQEGATVTCEDDPQAIPPQFRDPSTTLVVYTPAVPRDTSLWKHFEAAGYEMVKRARMLGELTAPGKSLCFAGTHGKTTTSSMAAHVLQSGSQGCNAFLGGILRNYNTNLLLSPTAQYSVVEADEYDRSFHWLRPWVAVVTSCDPDHLDIYGTPGAYRESFAHFTSLIKPGGALVMHTGIALEPRLQPGVRLYTYGRDHGDYHATGIKAGEGRLTFDLVTPHGTIEDIELGVPVDINIDNAVAALAAIDVAGGSGNNVAGGSEGDTAPGAHAGALDADIARRAMATYMGAKRRFEFHLKEEGEGRHVIIDDYAHHPDEIKASIASVRKLYPDARLTVAFQPHLYSRTRDFAPQFAAALSQADEVIMLPIYPAREEPIEGVDSQLILKDVTAPVKKLILRENLVSTLKKDNFEILMTLGAGDLNLLIDDIKAAVGR